MKKVIVKNYNVGDKVRLIKNINSTTGQIGETYTIKHSNIDEIDYELDGLIAGWVTEEEIELVESLNQ